MATAAGGSSQAGRTGRDAPDPEAADPAAGSGPGLEGSPEVPEPAAPEPASGAPAAVPESALGEPDGPGSAPGELAAGPEPAPGELELAEPAPESTEFEDLPTGAGSSALAMPAGFVWGVATSAFQIEGDACGRGDSIWDEQCRHPGRIDDASDARTACDHVHRYREDVGLMRELGVDAYRFSISWPRVMLGGRGPLVPTGIGFYDRLVDALLEAGIQPWVTLYHWDLPLELQRAGGWPHRDLVDRFTDYAVAVHAALGDRVRHWTTLNEPWCSAWLGHGSGRHAPGITDRGQAVRAAHHLLLAHGRALIAMREQAPADHQFGIVLNLSQFGVASSVPEPDRSAVAAVARHMDGLGNRWWLDALLAGRYPDDTSQALNPYLDGVIQDGDLAEIAQPLDYLGVNYYFDHVLVPAARPGSDERAAFPGSSSVASADPAPNATTMGWPVTPSGLRDLLLRIGREYPAAPPLVVAENGSAYPDEPKALRARGPIPDPLRVAYLRAHLDALADAISQGADVSGYFAWSLLDNFEWSHGYTQRFGLVRVDFDTLRRRPRQSFSVYRQAIAASRAAARSVTPLNAPTGGRSRSRATR